VQDQVNALKGNANLVPQFLVPTQMGVAQDADPGVTHAGNPIN
jgi:hypothetical protein